MKKLSNELNENNTALKCNIKYAWSAPQIITLDLKRTLNSSGNGADSSGVQL